MYKDTKNIDEIIEEIEKDEVLYSAYAKGVVKTSEMKVKSVRCPKSFKNDAKEEFFI